MLALHIPEEDRCIDILELIEYDKLLSFHAHTLALYCAVCYQSNYRAAHTLCSHVDQKQLLYAMQSEYMSGPLRMGFYNLLIALHLESFANTMYVGEGIVKKCHFSSAFRQGDQRLMITNIIGQTVQEIPSYYLKFLIQSLVLYFEQRAELYSLARGNPWLWRRSEGVTVHLWTRAPIYCLVNRPSKEKSDHLDYFLLLQ